MTTMQPDLFAPPAPSPRHWLGVASADHVARGVAGGFCQLSHGKAGPVTRMRPGDGIVYYSPRAEMGAGDAVQSFTAIGIVADAAPYQAMMGTFTAMRRDVIWWPVRPALIRPMLDALDMTRGHANWGMIMRRGSFAISAADFALIAQAMAATGP
jgi:hypothetical protein